MAEALLRTGSPDYTVRAGATLDELSRFAEGGDLKSVSVLYNLYRAAVSADERQLRKAVPVKILNRYFYRFEQSSKKAIDLFEAQRPGWRGEVQAVLSDPVAFETVVRSMAIEIKEAEARQSPTDIVTAVQEK